MSNFVSKLNLSNILSPAICQPFLVKGSVRMQWHRAGLIASWEFSKDHIERRNDCDDTCIAPVEEHCNRRWGCMVVVKSLELSLSIPAALKETSSSSSSEGNMLHIALVGFNTSMGHHQDRFVLSFYDHYVIL